ncbi:MAG TPA: hypothetical protein VLB80_04895 [Candidatus Babeliales bacterium]|nr:hypothetical protein [Candidatus Babeliales bacterium]
MYNKMLISVFLLKLCCIITTNLAMNNQEQTSKLVAVIMNPLVRKSLQGITYKNHTEIDPLLFNTIVSMTSYNNPNSLQTPLECIGSIYNCNTSSRFTQFRYPVTCSNTELKMHDDCTITLTDIPSSNIVIQMPNSEEKITLDNTMVTYQAIKSLFNLNNNEAETKIPQLLYFIIENATQSITSNASKYIVYVANNFIFQQTNYGLIQFLPQKNQEQNSTILSGFDTGYHDCELNWVDKSKPMIYDNKGDCWYLLYAIDQEKAKRKLAKNNQFIVEVKDENNNTIKMLITSGVWYSSTFRLQLTPYGNPKLLPVEGENIKIIQASIDPACAPKQQSNYLVKLFRYGSFASIFVGLIYGLYYYKGYILRYI